MKSRFERARKWLIFWCLFIGIGAVAGSVGMFVAPDGSALGMDEMLPYFQVLPFAEVVFQDFIFPGISLLIVNGLTNLIAAFLLVRRKKAGILLGGLWGITLMLWICIQFYIFPMNFMSTIYFIFGLCQACTGYAAYVFYKQEEFARNESRDIQTDKAAKSQLVVYFSRMGYTRHYAMNLAEKLGADRYEVKATELTEGTLGFWWCGRFGMHGWEMPIEEPQIDWDKYEKVIICSPIWVFQLCGPMRSFCKLAAGKIKRADYVLVHFQKNVYKNALQEMNQLLGITYEHATSICFRQGKEVKRYELNER